MALRRREVELSVERSLGSGGVVRLTARFDPGGSSAPPPLEELKVALGELVTELDALVGAASPEAAPARAERGLGELVETYRPRQRELIDLLREEGELTVGEHALLAANLPSSAARPPPASSPAPVPPTVVEPPLARTSSPPSPAPSVERGLPAARPVPELLRVYQISSLRQAGAVRARRQISFAEYMALKRHFEASEHGGADDGPASRTA